jgi:hypothetical protein
MSETEIGPIEFTEEEAADIRNAVKEMADFRDNGNVVVQNGYSDCGSVSVKADADDDSHFMVIPHDHSRGIAYGRANNLYDFEPPEPDYIRETDEILEDTLSTTAHTVVETSGEGAPDHDFFVMVEDNVSHGSEPLESLMDAFELSYVDTRFECDYGGGNDGAVRFFFQAPDDE